MGFFHNLTIIHSFIWSMYDCAPDCMVSWDGYIYTTGYAGRGQRPSACVGCRCSHPNSRAGHNQCTICPNKGQSTYLNTKFKANKVITKATSRWTPNQFKSFCTDMTDGLTGLTFWFCLHFVVLNVFAAQSSQVCQYLAQNLIPYYSSKSETREV